MPRYCVFFAVFHVYSNAHNRQYIYTKASGLLAKYHKIASHSSVLVKELNTGDARVMVRPGSC